MNNQPITVGALVELFLVHQRPVIQAKFTDWLRVARLFAASFGGRPAAGIGPSEVKAWICGKDTWKTPTTRFWALKIIKRLFSWAVSDGWLRQSPIKALNLQQGPPRRPTSEEEFQVMLRGSPPAFRRVLIFLRATGARPAAPRDMQWEWVNLEEGIIVVPSVKTGKALRPRIIVLVPSAVQLLRWIQRQHGKGHVFRNANGQPWSQPAIARCIGSLRARCGLSSEATLYGIRYLFAGQVLRSGGDCKLLARLLDHGTTAGKDWWRASLDKPCLDAMREIASRAAKRPRRPKPPRKDADS